MIPDTRSSWRGFGFLLLHLIVVLVGTGQRASPWPCRSRLMHLVVSARSVPSGEQQTSEKSRQHGAAAGCKGRNKPCRQRSRSGLKAKPSLSQQQQREPVPVQVPMPSVIRNYALRPVSPAERPCHPLFPAGSASGKPAASLVGEKQGAAGKPAEGVSADSLRQYRIALAVRLCVFATTRHWHAHEAGREWLRDSGHQCGTALSLKLARSLRPSIAR